MGALKCCRFKPLNRRFLGEKYSSTYQTVQTPLPMILFGGIDVLNHLTSPCCEAKMGLWAYFYRGKAPESRASQTERLMSLILKKSTVSRFVFLFLSPSGAPHG